MTPRDWRANRIAICRGCGARGVWMRTRYGKNVLVELASTTEAEQKGSAILLFDPKRHVAHFAKCPKADEFRRPRQKPEGGR